MRTSLLILLLLGSPLAYAHSKGVTPEAAPPPAATRDLGDVAFPNSGAKAAQGEFLRGLAQLHNFEYEDAALHFRAAQKIDPGFAMAYWGEAMTENHGIWHQQDAAAARAILARLGATPAARAAKAGTAREREWLATLDVLYGEGSKEDRDQRYAQAMAALHAHYPDDVEAAAFHALAILSSAEHGRDFATYMRAAAVLEEVYPTHPRHPGVVHYLIHSYDDPVHAPLGLRAARSYAKIAPEAGHAQHMTSHIFLALGMWDDVVDANRSAVQVVNRQRALAGKPPRGCGHYNEWLLYALLQQDRVADARRVLDGCHADAQRGAEGTKGAEAPPGESFAEMRSQFVVNARGSDADVVGWSLPAGAPAMATARFAYADVLAAVRRGDETGARAALVRLEAATRDALAALGSDPDPGEQGALAIRLEQMRIAVASLAGADPIAPLRALVEREQALPIDFGPPAIYVPSAELLGDALLQAGQADEARAAFRTALERAPGRRLSQQGLARAAAMR